MTRILQKAATSLIGIGFAVSMMLAVQTAKADTSIVTATVTAVISSAASLSLGASTVTFANANPAVTASIPATENAVNLTANARTTLTGAVLLTVLATGDLTSGSNTIPISNVTYTATGTGFAAGTLNKTTAQTVGSWTGSGVHTGSLSFFLANSFTYVTGTYTTTLTYTLLAP